MFGPFSGRLLPVRTFELKKAHTSRESDWMVKSATGGEGRGGDVVSALKGIAIEVCMCMNGRFVNSTMCPLTHPLSFASVC